MPNIETIGSWLWPWVVGLFVALVVGHLVTKCFLEYLRDWMGYSKETLSASQRRVPPGLTGFIERLLFTTFVGAGVEGYPTAMIAWLALKMASNWNFSDKNGESIPRAFALSALLAGGVSMLFSFLGGMARRWLSGLC